MTPKELEKILSTINLGSLSIKDLSSYNALLSVYETKTKKKLVERKFAKTHFLSKSEE